MILKENTLFGMPSLTGGSFSGLDRLYIPHSILLLKNVEQREDNGNIEIICQAKDGPEIRRGWLHFKNGDRDKKDILYKWLSQKIGNTVDSIYNSEFLFE